MISFSIRKYKDQMIKMLSELIAIPSVLGEPQPNMPYGRNTFKALMYMLDQAERLDLESYNLFGHTGYAKYGSGKDVVAVLSHLDVVPAGDGWSSDPFKAEIRDGRIYGRGAVDNKCAAVASLFALHALKENCIQLRKEVRVIFGCNEESEWTDIDFYKEKEGEPDYVFTPDANFPIINREKGALHAVLTCPAQITESGMNVLEIDSGTRPNIVPCEATCVLSADIELVNRILDIHAAGLPVKITAEKCDKGTRINVEGKPAHGAHPEQGINALAYLVTMLSNLPLEKNTTSDMIYALGEKIGTDYRGNGLGIAAKDDVMGELSVNLGSLHMQDGVMKAQIDIRYPICMPTETLKKAVCDGFAKYGVEVVPIMDRPPHMVSEDSELVTKLKVAYEEVMGEPAACLCSSGATYARAFKNGVAFGPVPIDRPSTEHGADEYIEVEDFIKLAEAIANAIVHICGAHDDILCD